MIGHVAQHKFVIGKLVGRSHSNRWLRYPCGLLLQVGAIYRAQGPDRDSSLKVSYGPRDSYSLTHCAASVLSLIYVRSMLSAMASMRCANISMDPPRTSSAW